MEKLSYPGNLPPHLRASILKFHVKDSIVSRMHLVRTSRVVVVKDQGGRNILIEESDRPICPSFWLPPSLLIHSKSGCSPSSSTSSSSPSSSTTPLSTSEPSNYVLLSDVLRHVKLKKEDFCRRFRDQVRIVSVPGEEFDSKATCNQVLTSVSSLARTGLPSRGSKRRGSTQDNSGTSPSSSRHHQDTARGCCNS